MLRVLEDYQGQGLGKQLVKTMVGEALKLGLVPFVHIEDDNEMSKKFFSKLGFNMSEEANWINHIP